MGYSDVLMKTDLYNEYKNTINRYQPVEEIQKQMQKYTMKNILHQYLRVRNLCDQGITDPDEVADLLNLPQYVAEDLVSEYYLIPEKFDRRNYANVPIVSDRDPRMELVVGLPKLLNPYNLLKNQPTVSPIDVALYVGIYSILNLPSFPERDLTFNIAAEEYYPVNYVILDDSSCYQWHIKHLNNRSLDLTDLDLVQEQLPFNWRMSHGKWLDDYISALKARIEDYRRDHIEELPASPVLDSAISPEILPRKIWRMYPGNAKTVKPVVV